MTEPWCSLIEGMLEGVWVLDPVTLHILAMNRAAADMLGVDAQNFAGKPVLDLAATPEDIYFWEDVAAGRADSIQSETLLRHSDGTTVHVERRVSRVWLDPGRAVFVVSIRDLSDKRRTELELEKLVAELRATLESTAEGVLVTDLEGAVRSFNQRFSAIWALPAELLTHRDDAALMRHMQDSVVDVKHYAQRLSEMLESPLLEGSDVLQLRSGQLIERVTLPQYSRGRAIGRVYSFRDITQARADAARLELAAKVFESSLDAIFITGPDDLLLAINPHFKSMTRCSSKGIDQRPARGFFYDPNDAVLGSRIAQALELEGAWEGEVWCRCDDGAACPVQLSWVALRDSLGVITNTIGIFRDLSEKLAANRRIEQLAYSDALTGVPNRLALAQRVGVALSMAERRGGSFAILFVDLDRFKNINDSYGHQMGDGVLREVAERINLCLRQEDTLCRLGGDEFAVFLNGAEGRGAESMARRILDALALPFVLEEETFSVGCSMGIAMYPTDGRTLEALISCADTAMHRVKDHGRGNFRFYQPQMNVDLLARMRLDHAMRQAMEQGLFQLHYQPKVAIGTDQITGAEALIRWRDATLGDVSPGVFIPLAEESGFIITIGSWVLDQAVRQAALWHRGGTPVKVAINVSALQFQQADFVQRVAQALARENLAPNLLELELTESILVQGVDEAMQRLDALSAMGVGLAIDDFGVGYSSLAYLKKFPIHTLKIDKSFVMGLATNESDYAIVSAIINLGHALNLKVVAEGVETTAQRDVLRELRCDQYQGFLYAKGLPVPEFERLMQADAARSFSA
jgi:diguanylate cyclase (GGDEF)-like protein/PAS domain S-box-containing protein